MKTKQICLITSPDLPSLNKDMSQGKPDYPVLGQTFYPVKLSGNG